MDSFSSGEVLVIALVSLVALDPKTAGRWWSKFRRIQRRLLDARSDIEREIRATIEEEPVRRESAQDRLRTWGRERVASLGQTERDQAGAAVLERLRAWEPYRAATDVSAFVALARELPTHEILAGILADGKRLWLPWTGPEAGSMAFAPVADLSRDLVDGAFGIQEPIQALRGGRFPEGGLALVPGEVFDLHGARIGKGGGYYDRWLALRPDVRTVALCWDAQVHPGRLPQGIHDRPVGSLLTPVRFVHFAATQSSEPASPSPTSNPLEDTNA